MRNIIIDQRTPTESTISCLGGFILLIAVWVSSLYCLNGLNGIFDDLSTLYLV